MDSLLLPSKIEFEPGASANQATFVVEPFVHGYGTTVGNALRRVLLSSLPGAAAVAFKVKGAAHEFATLPGVKEDVVELMLNLKQLRLRVFSPEEIRLTLSARGTGVVTASQIEKNAQVEIANPDLKLATLTDKKAELEMEIFVRSGRGYVPVEERLAEKVELGVLAIDALYSPVKEVSLRIEEVRVGQITNFDKLIMAIETDGTVSPRQAVEQSLKILLDHFQLINQTLIGTTNESEPASSVEITTADEAAEPTETVLDDAPKKKVSKKKKS